MTTSHEIPSPEPNNEARPVDEKLQMEFDRLLNNLSDKLKTYCTPDMTSLETKRASFGAFGDGSLDVSRTDYKGTQTSTITFSGGEMEDNSGFSFSHIQQGEQTGLAWLDKATDKHCSSRMVLFKLERNWPITDDDFPREKVRALMFDRDSEVTPEFIFGLLDAYTELRDTAGINASGMSWTSHDFDAHATGEKTGEQAATLSIATSDSSKLIIMDVVVAHRIGDAAAPLTCRTRCDEMGNVTVSADYTDPRTNEKVDVSIESHEQFLDRLILIAEKMAKAKMDEARATAHVNR